MKNLQTTSIIAALGLAGVISSAAHAGTSPTTFKQVGKYKISHCIAQLPDNKRPNSPEYQDFKQFGYNFCSKQGEKLIDLGVSEVAKPNFDKNKKLLRFDLGHEPEADGNTIVYAVVDKNNYVALLPLQFIFKMEDPVDPDYLVRTEGIVPSTIDLAFKRNQNKICVIKEVGLGNMYLDDSLLYSKKRGAPCVYLKTNKKGQPYWEWKSSSN